MRLISIKSLFLLLTSALIGFHWSRVYSSDVDMPIDYAPILERCCGITDEPSIFDNCSPEYSAIRVTEGAGGYPVGLIRVENQRDSAHLTSKLYENYNSPDVKETEISETEWVRLVQLLQASGFWTFDKRSTSWTPHGPSLWIEACVTGQFRSISINPDVESQMTEIVDFLVKLRS